LVMVLLTAAGCAVRRTTRIHPLQPPPPAREVSAAELVAKVNAQSEAIRTLVATVDLEPTAGSVYSGVIKEYRDVRGFILLAKPATIRMIGQAPVVRTSIFDMVSDGQEFRLYIPPKQKFIVGTTEFRRPAKNSLENLRPQHILEALLVPSMDPTRDKYVLEEAEDGWRRYYVVTVLEPEENGELALRRKVWFDRSSFEILRLQIYGPRGAYIEDVWYSDYRDFQGVRYPSHLAIRRPIEDYSLSITIVKATFNQPIAPEKFELKQPAGAELIQLSAARAPEVPGDQ